MSPIMVETAIIMAVGLLGAVLPLVPGPPIVWLGALYYAWRTGWTEIGWPALVLLLLLSLVGSTADLWMGYLGASRGGASMWSTLASLVGGVIGLFVFSVPGAIIGSVGAIAVVEYLRHRNLRQVMRASGGFMIGWLLATVVEFGICLMMIGLFSAALYV